jgi:hypothetical protein
MMAPALALLAHAGRIGGVELAFLALSVAAAAVPAVWAAGRLIGRRVRPSRRT